VSEGQRWAAAVAEGDQLAVRCVLMRGGTSRGAFLLAEDLPDDPALRDRVLLAIYGSPDPRQIDGIGGADPLTSKVAIVSRSSRPDADVDYLFGQVRIDEPVVDYRGNCGNMLAGVGPFAIDEGLVTPLEPVTSVRIHNVNSDRLIIAEVPVATGRARATGGARIAGVPGTGAGILLDFSATGGTLGRGLLPTGSAREKLALGGGDSCLVSIVDAGAPSVFVAARDLGLEGEQFVARPLDAATVERLANIRAAAAERLGLVADRTRAASESPAIPKVYAVHEPVDFVDSLGRAVLAAETTLVGRGLSMGRPHGAYATTVAVATATATRIPGTVVAEQAAVRGADERDVLIAHPGGVTRVEIDVDLSAGEPRLRRAGIERTARRIMAGLVYVSVESTR
jgi:2-methylaconitate cis-trans-isomerase PrpF